MERAENRSGAGMEWETRSFQILLDSRSHQAMLAWTLMSDTGSCMPTSTTRSLHSPPLSGATGDSASRVLAPKCIIKGPLCHLHAPRGTAEMKKRIAVHVYMEEELIFLGRPATSTQISYWEEMCRFRAP